MLFRQPPVPEVDPIAAQRMVADGALLLDVREPGEWRAGHAAGATLVPLGRLDSARLPAGRSIVAVCRSGHRSATATAYLRAAGIEAVNLGGGMQAWHAAGLPVRRDDGSAGEVA